MPCVNSASSSRGALFHRLQREQRFNEERSRFHGAKLPLALEHLYELDIV